MVPFGPCPTIGAGHAIPGAWLQGGLELEPTLVERAGLLRAVSTDMGPGYAKSVPEHAPQAVICINPYHEALNNKVRLITRRAYGFHSANAALALVLLTCGRSPFTYRTSYTRSGSDDTDHIDAEKARFSRRGQRAACVRGA
jgi:hypothetical protein